MQCTLELDTGLEEKVSWICFELFFCYKQDCWEIWVGSMNRMVGLYQCSYPDFDGCALSFRKYKVFRSNKTSCPFRKYMCMYMYRCIYMCACVYVHVCVYM